MHLLLTDRFCDRAKATTQTDYFDENVSGLALRVTPNGAKAWTFLYTWSGKRRRITLGHYPAVSLANARTLALEAKATIAVGGDPSRRAGEMTVADLVESYIAKHVSTLRAAGEISRRLRKNIVPVIGNVTLGQLHRRDATRVIDAINGRGAPVEAALSFQYLRSMLRWAVARGDLDHDPIAGMPAPPGSKPRERVLTDDEIRQLWIALPIALARSPDCQRIIKLCLLTAQRVGEVAGMRWDELDLAQGLWSLPGSRTKNGHPHKVPLSNAALDIIGNGAGEFVFGNPGPLQPSLR